MAHTFSKLREPLMADPVNRMKIDTITRAMCDALELSRLRDRLDASYEDTPRVEHQEDLYLSTLRACIAEMGDRLELRAVFPGGAVEFTPIMT
jgi:hypothetical protein